MERFEAWEYVFDTCRERNKPMRVQIGDERWKVFPSGRAEPLNKAAIKAGDRLSLGPMRRKRK